MLLATTQIEDLDRFLEVFSTAGAEKRKQHGSKGALVFRDPSEDDRVWVVFDWDDAGLAELRVRPRGPRDHAEGRAQGATVGRAVRRPVRGLNPLLRGGAGRSRRRFSPDQASARSRA